VRLLEPPPRVHVAASCGMHRGALPASTDV